jgi:anthranilate phosphoribosyltransferase
MDLDQTGGRHDCLRPDILACHPIRRPRFGVEAYCFARRAAGCCASPRAHSPPDAGGALEPAGLARCIREVGVGFVFAPKYHPAFKAVVEARKLLAAEGQRSIFNLLGPLLNPTRPAHQLIGVFDEKLVPVFADILKQLGRKAAWVVHGTTGDGRGMDELSTLGLNTVVKLRDGNIEPTTLDPATLGFARASLADLAGGGALRAECRAAPFEPLAGDQLFALA